MLTSTAPAEGYVPARPRGWRPLIAGLAILVALGAVLLVLTFRSGAYFPASWLLPTIALAVCGAVAVVLGPRVRLSRVQMVLLLAFGLQALWTALSIIWADSRSNAWEETNRTLLYLVAVGLVVAGVRWNGRKALYWLAGGLVAVMAVVAFVIMVKVGSSADPLSFFARGRLNYPISYWNGLAAFFMIGFWLALGLANTGVARYWTQPLLLAVATVFLELGLLPQSRGAFYAMLLVVPFFVILSSNRFRALTHLTMMAIPVIVFWSPLNNLYVALEDGEPVLSAIDGAFRAIALSVLIVLVLWTVSWAVEKLVERYTGGGLRGRLARWIGVALAVVAMLCAAGGLVALDQRTEGLGALARDGWASLVSDKGPGGEEESTRYGEMGLNGRLTQWRVAEQAYAANRLTGVGAQSFEIYYTEHRTTPLSVRHPHSQPMQLLAELGLPGAALWIVFTLGVLVRAAIVRFRATRRSDRAVMAAMVTAALAWLIHSSADMLWQLTALTLPAMLLFGGLLAAGGGRPPEPAAGSGSRRANRASRYDSSWLKWSVRGVGLVFALAILASVALPYLSLKHVDRANTKAFVDRRVSMESIDAAGWLDPLSPAAAETKAEIFAATASLEPVHSAGALENLALAAAAWVEAGEREPKDWSISYGTALAVLDYRDASRAAVEAGLAGFPEAIPGPDGVLAATDGELTDLAAAYAREAQRLNPLSKEIEKTVESVRGP